MEDLKIIALVTTPTKWFFSLTYPTKPGGSLRICLDLHDLSIIGEHYKVPTFKESSHQLSGTTVLSKMDMKDGFWSIHLDILSSYLPTSNTKRQIPILKNAFHTSPFMMPYAFLAKCNKNIMNTFSS